MKSMALKEYSRIEKPKKKSPAFWSCLLFCLSLLLQPSRTYADTFVDHITPLQGATESNNGLEIFLKPGTQLGSVSFSPGGTFVEEILPFPSHLRGLAHQENGTVIAVTAKGVSILSSEDDTGKRTKGNEYVVEGARIVRVNGDDVYVAGKEIGLLQMQVNQEGGLSLVARYKPERGLITDVFLTEKRVYVVLDRKKILFLDMQQTVGNQVIGQYQSRDEIYKLFVSGKYCFVAAGEAGIIQLEIKNVHSVLEVGRFNTSGIAKDLVVVGENIYVADGSIGLTVLTLPKQQRMGWKSSVHALGFVEQVRVSKGYAFVRSRDSIITKIDISKPEKPKVVSRFFAKEEVIDFQVVNGKVLAAFSSSLRQVVFPHKDPPLFTNDGVNHGGSRRVFLKNTIAYVADWFSGLHLYNVSNPSRPSLISNFHTPGSPKGVFVKGDYAYIGDDDHGLQIVDISNPLLPRLVSNLPLPGLAYTMALSGQNLFVAGHRGGFNVVDIAEPENPALIGRYDTDGKVWALAVQGEYLFVADDSTGLLVFDIATPQLPIQVAKFNPGGFAEDVLIQDNLAYVAFFDKGVYILDISNPVQPKQIGHITFPGTARGLFIEENLLYVAGWKAGLFIYDLYELPNPKFLGNYDTEGAVWGVQVRDGVAYVMDWWGGFKVLDVSSPANIRFLGDYHGQGSVQDVVVKEHYAYVAKGAGGFQVFDVKNPLFPVWVAGVDTSGEAIDVALSGRYAAIALSDGGVAIIDIENPFEPRQVASLPTKGRGKIVQMEKSILYLYDDQTGVVIAELREDGSVVERSLLSGEIQDMCVGEKGELFLALESSVVRIDVSTPFQPELKGSYDMNGKPSLVRFYEGKLVVYEEGRGITFFNIESEAVNVISFIPIKKEVHDMKLFQGKFTVSVEGQGILVYEQNKRGSFELIQQYNPGPRYTKLAISKQWVFLAGSDFLSSIKLLPKLAFAQGNLSSVIINPPKSFPAGVYSLDVVTAKGKHETLNNVLHIKPPPPPKNRFTKEEYKKILQEKKATVKNKK